MSTDAMKWCDTTYPTYNGKPDSDMKHILRFLCWHANERERHSLYWGEPRMLRELCMGRDRFRSRKKALVEAGYIRIEERRRTTGRGKAQRTSSRIFVNLYREPDTYAKAEAPAQLADGRARAASHPADYQDEPVRRRRHLEHRNPGGYEAPPPSDWTPGTDLAPGAQELTKALSLRRGRRSTHEEEEGQKKKTSFVGPSSAAALPLGEEQVAGPADPRDTSTIHGVKVRSLPKRRTQPLADVPLPMVDGDADAHTSTGAAVGRRSTMAPRRGR